MADKQEPTKKKERCARCGDSKQIFIVDRVVQGQDYGPETEGHYIACPSCT